MIAIERPYDDIEAEAALRAGEPAIRTIEADADGCGREWEWECWRDPDDPALRAAAVQALLDELARTADFQAACIRASFRHLAESADALAATMQAGNAAVVVDDPVVRATATAVVHGVAAMLAAFWTRLRAFLHAFPSWPEPDYKPDVAYRAYLDLRFLVAGAHWPEEAYKRPGAKEAHERAREAALTALAERIAERWRVRPRERGTMRRVAKVLSQQRHDLAVLLGVDVAKIAHPTEEEEETAHLTEEEKTARLEKAFARLTSPAARLTGAEGIVDPYDRLQPRRAGDGAGDGAGAGHMATKIALLQGGALVLALGDALKPLRDVRWWRRIPQAVRQLGAACGVEMCALHLPREEVLAWVQAQAIKEAEHEARARVYGGDDSLDAANRSRRMDSLDTPDGVADAERVAASGFPEFLGADTRAWARRDPLKLMEEMEDVEEVVAKAERELTPMEHAVFDAVVACSGSGDRKALADALDGMQLGTIRYHLHNIRRKLKSEAPAPAPAY